MRRSALVLAASLAGSAAAPALDLDLAKIAPSFEACPGRPGFVRMPGARNCTRLSGRVAAGVDARAGSGGAAAAPVVAGRIAIDNRADTEFGEVRTYVRVGNGRR
ncbi:porin [Methylobacterium sp. J-076]|uniref:porin n=1 Tax=Methylobacterium sp. J-076 TaxID=2836655 RepID=UPI001FBBF48C|nr:porin [Methylobacterium sp. J-076]MCJ2015364.1 porin [Methylobacterium sp. J-076]